MEKILSIPPELNFIPNAPGCHGLSYYRHVEISNVSADL